MDWYRCGLCGLRAEAAVVAEQATCPGRGDDPCGGEWVAEAAVFHTGGRVEPLRLWDLGGRLLMDAVSSLVSLARVVVEGRVYKATAPNGGHRASPLFLGTALLTVDLARIPLVSGPADPATVHRLRDAIVADRRSLIVLRDRAWQETVRLLGPEAPLAIDIVPTLLARGTALLADLDIEGPVEEAWADRVGPVIRGPGAVIAVQASEPLRAMIATQLKQQAAQDGTVLYDAGETHVRHRRDDDPVPAHLDTAQHLPRAALARTTIDQAPPPDLLDELREDARDRAAELYRSDLDAIATALGLGARPAGLGDIEWQAMIEEEAERLRALATAAGSGGSPR